MANNCLIKTLKGSATADLPAVGEARIHIKSTKVFNLAIQSAIAQTLTIVGDGTFTSTGLKTQDIPVNSGTGSYDIPAGDKYQMSAGEYILIIPNKYEILSLNVSDDDYVGVSTQLVEFPVEDIMYMAKLKYFKAAGLSGSCKSINNFIESCSKLAQIISAGARFSGDISDLKDNVLFGALRIQYSSVTGNFPSSGLKFGKLSMSSNVVATTNDLVKYYDVISELAGNYTSVTGNISVFSGCSNLLKFNLNNCTGVYGDLSTLPSTTFEFFCPPNVPFTWSANGRASGSKFLGIGQDGNISKAVELGSHIDNMLKNQASATDPAKLPISYSKIVNVTGTSDYATDSDVKDAIRTIRDTFGVKIIINGKVITTSVVPA